MNDSERVLPKAARGPDGTEKPDSTVTVLYFRIRAPNEAVGVQSNQIKSAKWPNQFWYIRIVIMYSVFHRWS